MRERDINRKMFHRGHYEVIAKRFREALDPYMSEAAVEELEKPEGQLYVKAELVACSSALVTLAVDFAKRLQADNDEFDPIIFLDRCSPNPERYKLSQLWQYNEQAGEGSDGNSNGSVESQ